jgi:hypothetical protein
VLDWRDRLRGARGSIAMLAVALGALSCAALIGIDDRLADDELTDGGSGDASLDSPSTVPDAGSPLRTYGVGDGHRGPLATTANNNIQVNSYAALAANVQGVDRLTFTTVRGAEPFAAGDLVLVHQSASPAAAPGNTSPLDVMSTNLGHWEVARVTSIAAGADAGGDAGGGGELTLDHAVGGATPFTVPGAQIIRVPEYTDVTVVPSSGLYALGWDGVTGGVLAFYASGTLRNDGVVSVEGAGLRGGVAFLTNDGSLAGCSAPDGVPDAGYARKGEGAYLFGAFGDAGGYAPLANGGGGGNCYNAGGGGGGNGGVGGNGGFSGDGDGGRDVGGRGGLALGYPSLLSRLTLGGGGGAGEADNGREVHGGNGGGILLVRAQSIVGAGRFSARGYSASQKGDASGGGGGGAGGSALLQSASALTCAQALTVAGGRGGSLENYNAANGPGGGGSGGRALLQGKPTACSIDNRAGTAGLWENGNVRRGATPDAGLELAPPYATDPEILGEAYCGTCP